MKWVSYAVLCRVGHRWVWRDVSRDWTKWGLESCPCLGEASLSRERSKLGPWENPKDPFVMWKWDRWAGKWQQQRIRSGGDFPGEQYRPLAAFYTFPGLSVISGISSLQLCNRYPGRLRLFQGVQAWIIWRQSISIASTCTRTPSYNVSASEHNCCSPFPPLPSQLPPEND